MAVRGEERDFLIQHFDPALIQRQCPVLPRQDEEGGVVGVRGIIVPDRVVAADHGAVFQAECTGEIQRAVFQRGIPDHRVLYADFQPFKCTVFHIFAVQVDRVVYGAIRRFCDLAGVDLPDVHQIDSGAKPGIYIHHDRVVFESLNLSGGVEFSGKMVVAERCERCITGKVYTAVDDRVVFNMPVAEVTAVFVVGKRTDPATPDRIVPADHMVHPVEGNTGVDEFIVRYDKVIPPDRHAEASTLETVVDDLNVMPL